MMSESKDQENAALGTTGLDPLKPVGLATQLVQRRDLAVGVVEIAQERLHSAMIGVGEEVPIQAAVMVPFSLLRELPAHEQQLLAGMGEHEAEIGPQIGEALPTVPRHLADQRTLPV